MTKPWNLALPHGGESSDQRSGQGVVILLLDDNDLVLAVVTKVIERLGHRVYPVAALSEARALLDQGEKIDLVVTDVLLNGAETGIDLANDLWEVCPDFPVLFLTGLTCKEVYAKAIKGRNVLWLAKPASKDALGEAIQQLSQANRG